MRIWDNDLSSVTLRQIVVSKVENVDPKVPNDNEAEKGWCNKPTK